MPLPEAGVVVGAGFMVEVKVGAEDGGKGEADAKVHKGIQNQCQVPRPS